MRRIVFIVLMCGALLGLSAPAALARHHHRQKHHRVHRRARIERFGSASDPTQSSSSSSSSMSNDSAGTVTSFANGVLTITLNDGSTVSGDVTNATEMECSGSSSSTGMARDDGDGNGSNSGDNSGDNNNGNEDQNDANEQNDAQQNCSTDTLTPGTVVREAVLRISSAGHAWDKVDLATQSSSTTTSGDDDGNDNGGNDS